MVLAEDALAGKVAVVTGGGTGIGAGICEALAQAGAKVVISPNKNVEGAESTSRRPVRRTDLAGPASRSGRRALGALDILVRADDDFRASLRQRFTNAGADASPTTSDNRDFARQGILRQYHGITSRFL